jgi:hypothetical protein
MHAVECFVVLVIVVLLIIGVSQLTSPVRSIQSGPGAALRQLARNHRAVYRGGGFRRTPSVRLQYGATWAVITVRQRRGRATVAQATVDWPRRQPAFQIWSRRRRHRTGPVDEGPVIHTGDAPFDQRLLVVGAARSSILKWLSDGVRWQLLRLDEAFQPGHLSVEMSRAGKLVVEKEMAVRDVVALEAFCQMVLELYDQAMLTCAEGIEFLAQQEAQPLEDPICLVCGEPIGTDMVFCRSCRTPHHMECWQYIGKCTVFGCEQDQFVIPRIASRAQDDADHGPTSSH